MFRKNYEKQIDTILRVFTSSVEALEEIAQTAQQERLALGSKLVQERLALGSKLAEVAAAETKARNVADKLKKLVEDQ